MKNLSKEELVIFIITAIVVIMALFLTGYTVVADEVEYNTYIDHIWWSCTDEQRKQLPIEYQAYICGMSTYEFEYLARCVEAESDRSSNIEGKIMIAATILNRRTDSRFPGSISGVLDQPGQFETTYNGWCAISSTSSSRWAIVEAQRSLQNGDIPSNVLYFNSIGYNYGWSYGYFGGNYFSCA